MRNTPAAALALIAFFPFVTGCAVWESATAGQIEIVDPADYSLTFELCENPGLGEVLDYEATLTNLTDEVKRWELQVTMTDAKGTERRFANSIATPLGLNESDATLFSRSGQSDLVNPVTCTGDVLEYPLVN